MDLGKIFFLSKTALQGANKDVAVNDISNAWDSICTASLIVLIVMAVVSLGMAVYYYTLYNDRPGRHYTPMKWGLLYVINLVLVAALTFAIAFACQNPNEYHKLWQFEIQMTAINTGYAIFPYFILSWIWCQFDLPTNAYRFVKF